MLAVSSLQDTWPVLIISAALWLVQQVDGFNDRAHRPIPWARLMWWAPAVPQGEHIWGVHHFAFDFFN
ncbi:hypothetical protein ACTGJ9_010895 [Bradyrhizobium sp. RDM12]